MFLSSASITVCLLLLPGALARWVWGCARLASAAVCLELLLLLFWFCSLKERREEEGKWEILCLHLRFSLKILLLWWGEGFFAGIYSNAASSYSFLESSIPHLPNWIIFFQTPFLCQSVALMVLVLCN